jgi:hypothetical protein
MQTQSSAVFLFAFSLCVLEHIFLKLDSFSELFVKATENKIVLFRLIDEQSTSD